MIRERRGVVQSLVTALVTKPFMLLSGISGSGKTQLARRIAAGIDYPRLFAAKLTAFLGNDELGGYTYRFTRPESFFKPCMVLCNVFYYGVFLAAMAGLFGLLRSRRLGAWQLAALYILGLTLAHMLVEVSNRYHYSLIPLLILFAAAGFTRQSSHERSIT